MARQAGALLLFHHFGQLGVARLTDLPPEWSRCLAFRRTDPAFEPSLYQGQLPPSGNAIFLGGDKDLKTVPAIQSADCRDKMRAQIAANSGRFALNWEISVCAGLCLAKYLKCKSLCVRG